LRLLVKEILVDANSLTIRHSIPIPPIASGSNNAQPPNSTLLEPLRARFPILLTIYPMSCYLQADSMENQIMAVFVLCGVGLLLAIADAVSIAVAYSQ